MTTRAATATAVDALIGERVHQHLWRSRMTQAQLATALGLDPAAVTRRLRGRTRWSVTEVYAVADLLGCDVSELMPTHDELGHVGGLTRGNVAAESRCTPARANRTPLGLGYWSDGVTSTDARIIPLSARRRAGRRWHPDTAAGLGAVPWAVAR